MVSKERNNGESPRLLRTASRIRWQEYGVSSYRKHHASTPFGQVKAGLDSAKALEKKRFFLPEAKAMPPRA